MRSIYPLAKGCSQVYSDTGRHASGRLFSIGSASFWVPLLTLLLLTPSCGRYLPKLILLSGEECTETQEMCRKPFPVKPWRAIHAIHITGPFGRKSSVLGVTVVIPATRSIRAVIMSVEGMVLFDASYGGDGTTIHRSIPPLDRGGFSEGLLRDVSLMFMAPEGAWIQIGRTEDRHLVCRWKDDQGRTTDVVFPDDGTWRILRYDRDDSLIRKVNMTGWTGNLLAERVELVAYGIGGYTLDLRLVEAEPLTDYESSFLPAEHP